MFLKFIKRKIISSSIFWQYRHYIQPKWVDEYSKKDTNDLYFKIVSRNNVESVIDFGCSSGNLLFELKKNNENLLCYGIDINPKAIKTCKNKFKVFKKINTTYEFKKDICLKEIRTFLKHNNSLKFDLLVFDRVLYCLNDTKVNEILKKLSDTSSLILIDDFQLDNKHYKKGYLHRDWIKILSQFNYENIFDKPTMYQSVLDANPRTLLFKKRILKN